MYDFDFDKGRKKEKKEKEKEKEKKEKFSDSKPRHFPRKWPRQKTDFKVMTKVSPNFTNPLT